MSIVPSTGKEIIDKKTVAEAVAESIQKHQKEMKLIMIKWNKLLLF